jgi:hypothetical protein
MKPSVFQMARRISRMAPHPAARRAAVLACILGLGLALGACSKCDVPTWMPNQNAPHTCHDGPSPQ